jgi:hypothetical protein
MVSMHYPSTEKRKVLITPSFASSKERTISVASCLVWIAIPMRQNLTHLMSVRLLVAHRHMAAQDAKAIMPAACIPNCQLHRVQS